MGKQQHSGLRDILWFKTKLKNSISKYNLSIYLLLLPTIVSPLFKKISLINHGGQQNDRCHRQNLSLSRGTLSKP